uniref:Acyl-CoA oxidase C-terminal domain-containing protein n=1 Tax=Chloropicon laureae TaxID=464258 RepID=A0A7S2Z0T0_9CHLO
MSHIEDNLGDFLEAGVLGRDQAALVHEATRRLLLRVRPEAVALVDAFDHSDYALNSAIGSSDGDVYNRLLKMAQRNPFNATQEGPAWNDILGPFLNRNAKSKL